MHNTIDLSQYARDGYLLLRGFFGKSQMDEILNEAKEIFYAAMQSRFELNESVLEDQRSFDEAMFKFFELDSDAFIRAGKQTQHSRPLWKLAASDQIFDLLKAIELEMPIFSVRPSMFFNSRHLDKVGHYWKLGAHQDWRSSQGSIDSVTLWYPYVDCNKDLGALEVVPGSHLRGLLECSEVDYYSEIKDGLVNDEDYISVEMKAGDLLLFNSFLVHRSGTNVTRSVRWSTQLRYNNVKEQTFIDRRMPNPYTYKPFAELVEPGPPTADQIQVYFEEMKKRADG